MLEMFLNPFTMIIGAGLISAPILIHLINRMRFKRVRWAAMEFLLKAQKRVKRQLLIEQLILLLLRILMVLLVALLLGRFLGFSGVGGAEAQQTLHLFLLDDTPSMGDSWRVDGDTKTTYAVAKTLITENLGKFIAQAPTPQVGQVFRLSDLNNPRSFGRINPQSLGEMKVWLDSLKPSNLHVDLIEGLNRIKAETLELKNTEVVLHIVSDFRDVDWSSGNESLLKATFAELRTAGVKIVLVDTAHPDQGAEQKTPLYNDNLAIVDFRPESRIAAQYQQVEFQVDVANFSNAERKNVRVEVRLNGTARAEASINIPTLKPNEITRARTTLAPDRLGTPEAPLNRFNLVSAHLEAEQVGLSADNSRFTVIEVRDRVPVLLIEGKTNLLKLDRGRFVPSSKEAETFFLYKLFADTIKGYQVEVRPPSELEKLNLHQYSAIYLCDVGQMNDNTVNKLEEYVRSGGGLGIFLGPDIKQSDAIWYNEKMYKNGTGVFPAPIEKLPMHSDKTSDDQIVPSRWQRRLSGQTQVFVRNREHPAVESLYSDVVRGGSSDSKGYDRLLQFVVIDRYFPVNRLLWKDDPGLGSTVQEIMTLPNLKPMATYTAAIRALVDRIPVNEEKYADYRDVLSGYISQLKTIADGNDPLYVLGSKLSDMLTDTGDKDKNRPGLQVFWQKADNADLYRDAKTLLDIIRYGDPLYIAKKFGVGRVLAGTSSAGSSWNDLEGLSTSHFPPLMMSFQRYLSSASTDLNLLLGREHRFELNKDQYSPKVKKWLLSQEDSQLVGGQPRSPAVLTSRGDELMKEIKVDAVDPKPKTEKDPAKPPAKEGGAPIEKKSLLELTFRDGLQPGAYLFEFTEIRPPEKAGGEPLLVPDYRTLCYNLDAAHEGNLKRADRDDIHQIAGKEAKFVTFNTIDTIEDELKKPQHDLSESPWFYLIILMVLVGEQAMAVRLSFHSRANDSSSVSPLGMPLS